MEYLLQLLIEKIENSENQWKPGANGWKSLSNKAEICTMTGNI